MFLKRGGSLFFSKEPSTVLSHRTERVPDHSAALEKITDRHNQSFTVRNPTAFPNGASQQEIAHLLG